MGGGDFPQSTAEKPHQSLFETSVEQSHYLILLPASTDANHFLGCIPCLPKPSIPLWPSQLPPLSSPAGSSLPLQTWEVEDITAKVSSSPRSLQERDPLQDSAGCTITLCLTLYVYTATPCPSCYIRIFPSKGSPHSSTLSAVPVVVVSLSASVCPTGTSVL